MAKSPFPEPVVRGYTDKQTLATIYAAIRLGEDFAYRLAIQEKFHEIFLVWLKIHHDLKIYHPLTWALNEALQQAMKAGSPRYSRVSLHEDEHKVTWPGSPGPWKKWEWNQYVPNVAHMEMMNLVGGEAAFARMVAKGDPELETYTSEKYQKATPTPAPKIATKPVAKQDLEDIIRMEREEEGLVEVTPATSEAPRRKLSRGPGMGVGKVGLFADAKPAIRKIGLTDPETLEVFKLAVNDLTEGREVSPDLEAAFKRAYREDLPKGAGADHVAIEWLAIAHADQENLKDKNVADAIYFARESLKNAPDSPTKMLIMSLYPHQMSEAYLYRNPGRYFSGREHLFSNFYARQSIDGNYKYRGENPPGETLVIECHDGKGPKGSKQCSPATLSKLKEAVKGVLQSGEISNIPVRRKQVEEKEDPLVDTWDKMQCHKGRAKLPVPIFEKGSQANKTCRTVIAERPCAPQGDIIKTLRDRGISRRTALNCWQRAILPACVAPLAKARPDFHRDVPDMLLEGRKGDGFIDIRETTDKGRPVIDETLPWCAAQWTERICYEGLQNKAPQSPDEYEKMLKEAFGNNVPVRKMVGSKMIPLGLKDLVRRCFINPNASNRYRKDGA